MSADWDPDTFLPLIDSEFIITLTDPAITVPLTLVAVDEGRHSPGAPRPRPFSLTFTGPAGLSQGTFELKHATGPFPLFLVALQPGPDGVGRYEAVFN